jgi:hypothetical protein
MQALAVLMRHDQENVEHPEGGGRDDKEIYRDQEQGPELP